MSKESNTGTQVEHFVQHTLESFGHEVTEQVQADGLNSEWSKLDLVLHGKLADEVISLKFQQVTGTADEKICFEAESLAHMCRMHDYPRATIVLSGDAWQPVKLLWYLETYQPPSPVRIITYDEFEREYYRE